jgi:hypothetical protein
MLKSSTAGLESRNPATWDAHRLWSLWDMLRSYHPIYKIALNIQELRTGADFWKKSDPTKTLWPDDAKKFPVLLKEIHQKCSEYNLTDSSELAKHLIAGPAPENYAELLSELNHLEYTLGRELEKEAVFRVPPDQKKYYEQDDLFGPKVAAAFPSCERDIRKAGSCYALGQEDACVHHLMLVLERGLHALAGKVGVTYQRTNWQNIIDQIASKLKSLPRGDERDFYSIVNEQFGFLKGAYRNHSEHAHDDYYDMPKALHIFNHVKDFMQAIEKGGLTE